MFSYTILNLQRQSVLSLCEKEFNKQFQIGDFGLCRYRENSEVYVAKGGRLPIKWMAPESLELYQFTAKTDV